MAIVVIVFHLYQSDIQANQYFSLIVISSLLLGFIINFLMIDFLLKTYGKKQIRKISDSLPQIIEENEENLDFRELGERITDLNLKNITELDMMKEMEIYRREYLGNVSHELKTPLFSIQGYVETLQDGAIENLAIRDKYLDRIDKSVERLINIVTDLDMINKYEVGELKLEFTVFDINTLIKETFELLDLEAEKSDSKLILKPAENQAFAFADKQKIFQVLINLVSNAINYANREKSMVEVSTAYFEDKVVVSVKDNGMGIKPEVLPRIFERFFRAESSRSRKEGGSGLGLAIVKHILQAHGENIEAKSEYLEGTQFSFTLQKAR